MSIEEVTVQEINLYDLLKHYAKYWVVIAAATVFGLIAGQIYTQWVQVPAYKSNATLLVVNSSVTGSAEKTTLINNYIQLLKSRRVLEPVVEKLDLDQSYDQLVGSISTSNDKDTEVIKLSISSTAPQMSKEIVDATVDSFKNEIGELYQKDTIQIIDSANLPTEPYNVRSTIQIGLFTVAGFLLSIIVIFFIYDYQMSSSKSQVGKPISKPVAKKRSSKKSVPLLTRVKDSLGIKFPVKKAKKKADVITFKPVRNPKTGRFDSKPKAKPPVKKAKKPTTKTTPKKK